jgi:hypothetical protein
MAKNKLLLLAAAAAGVVAVTAGRSRSKKKSSGTAQSPTVVDSGIGFAEKLGINVNWGIVRASASSFSWRWNAQDAESAEEVGVASSDQGGPFGSEEQAFGELVEAIGLNPLPKPPAPVGEDGEVPIPPLPEPPKPPGPNPGLLPPGGMGLAQPPDGPGPIPEPPLFAVEVYPSGASPARLPNLTQADGIVFSDDQRVVGVGPLWWDALGNRAEELLGEGVTSPPEMLTSITSEVFPMAEIHLFVGPRMLYEAIEKRVNEYLDANS